MGGSQDPPIFYIIVITINFFLEREVVLYLYQMINVLNVVSDRQIHKTC